MNKTFRIYFKHNPTTLSIEAHHYELDGSEFKFFTDETTVNSDIYVADDSVAAIESFVPVKLEPHRSTSGSY